ncbi:ABC transporter permease [Sphingomonas mucosissima]|uniref:Macrolide export ATP-binding/permease protein MacB n=1 Tax=Sphingomonas mucosissima TaxID=370959 RepID=A0A245ZLB3_9SPHN|nr:ABC transporter permease [Sphingomonas mucosissima]OWK30534.1 macrolide export ATP-binding/permease protein MacB [Sphingomonas mucosissima]
MWRNYLTVSINALAKNRVYSIINLLGLAIGMAACLLILAFIRYETSFDRWVRGGENTYQLQTYFPNPRDGPPFFLQMASYVAEERIKKDFPQVESTVYLLAGSPTIVKDGQVTTAKDYLVANGDLLSVIDLPVLRGSKTALNAPDTAILTRSEAVRQFGTDDVVGRTMSLIQKGKTYDYRINAVVADLPKNSHLKINAVVRRDFPSYFAQEREFLTCWGCQSGWVYVKLKPGSNADAINAQMPAWEKRNIPDENFGGGRFNAGDEADWKLLPIADVHLGKAQAGAMTPGNDRGTIATFAVIAILILSMAVVNFTNLATARAGKRAREVALRKVLGATRKQLIGQFVGESLLVALIAVVIALALSELLIRPFASFLDADLTFGYFGESGMLLPALALVVIVGLLGGLYPAFFLSRFQPASVLKANKSSAETPGSGRLRSILVIGQFAISIALIICTAIVYGQTVYARSVDPGYKRDHILQVENLSRYQLIGRGEQLVERMKRVPGVVAVGRTDIGVATTNNSNTGVLVPGRSEPVTLGRYRVDTGFRDAMGLDVVAGRWFDPARPMDDQTLTFPETPEQTRALVARGANVVINEFAARKLGARTPQEIIGKTFGLGISADSGPMPVTVVGVVKDSRFRSVRDPLDPIVFLGTREGTTHMVIRYDGDPAAVRAGVERVWKQAVSDVPFEAQFSDAIVEDLYKAEERRAQIFAGFAILAVVIACLGLFGLAAFTAERRTKEIGIRKVLGARTLDIVRLLVWQFSRPVLVANLLAWPVAWWVMRDWLNSFDTRMALTPVPFLLAGALALTIAVVTIAGHAFKVARANPIKALRYE